MGRGVKKVVETEKGRAERGEKEEADHDHVERGVREGVREEPKRAREKLRE